MTDPKSDCLGCAKLRSELLDVGVAAGVYHESDYVKHLAPTPAVAKKAEEIDEAVIFMRTRGFVGSMLTMCKHVLRELEALDKAKNELIDERDHLLRIINDSFLSLHAPHSRLAFDGKNLTPHVQEAARTAETYRIERDNWLDCVRAMLVAAGAPEGIDEMEAEVKSAGNKPSDYIEHVVGSMRGILRRLRNDCGSMVFGHDAELVDDILTRSKEKP